MRSPFHSPLFLSSKQRQTSSRLRLSATSAILLCFFLSFVTICFFWTQRLDAPSSSWVVYPRVIRAENENYSYEQLLSEIQELKYILGNMTKSSNNNNNKPSINKNNYYHDDQQSNNNNNNNNNYPVEHPARAQTIPQIQYSPFSAKSNPTHEEMKDRGVETFAQTHQKLVESINKLGELLKNIEKFVPPPATTNELPSSEYESNGYSYKKASEYDSSINPFPPSSLEPTPHSSPLVCPPPPPCTCQCPQPDSLVAQEKQCTSRHKEPIVRPKALLPASMLPLSPFSLDKLMPPEATPVEPTKNAIIEFYDKINSAGKPRYRLVVAVVTSYPRIDNRITIRETWLNYLKDTIWDGEMTFKFVLGETSNTTLYQEALLENDKYGDLLFVPVYDTYRNLALKTMAVMRWAVESYDFDYILKIDDDSFIRLDKLMQILECSPKSRFYHGMSHGQYKPLRDPSNKWYVSYEDYPGPDPGPVLIAGPGYVLSRDCAEHIAIRSLDPKRRPIYLEDVNTAVLLQEIHVVGDDNPHFYSYFTCQNDMILTHYAPLIKMRAMYTHSISGDHSLCPPRLTRYVDDDPGKLDWDLWENPESKPDRTDDPAQKLDASINAKVSESEKPDAFMPGTPGWWVRASSEMPVNKQQVIAKKKDEEDENESGWKWWLRKFW
eukprot:TRINITY_DN158_c0_g1_i6.p1 TRINITY_DN158_c0_g1~~TRINITY_DN158_c0_g1_i6.p1  ORF type:complete len:665 (+),score=116.27 TRINITY_DN158_c0_g1_i6:195-2189(+)